MLLIVPDSYYHISYEELNQYLIIFLFKIRNTFYKADDSEKIDKLVKYFTNFNFLK